MGPLTNKVTLALIRLAPFITLAVALLVAGCNPGDGGGGGPGY